MIVDNRQFEAHLKGKKHIKAAQALRRAMREEDFALGVSDGMSTVGTATPVAKDENKVEEPEGIEIDLDEDPIIVDEARNVKEESEPEEVLVPSAAAVEDGIETSNEDEHDEKETGTKSDDTSKDSDEDLEKGIEDLLLDGKKPRTQAAQEAKPKIGAAKAKRLKRAEKQAALEAEGKAPPKNRKPRKPYDPAAAIQKARGETVSTGKKGGKK
jgi:hypothetical protein